MPVPRPWIFRLFHAASSPSIESRAAALWSDHQYTAALSLIEKDPGGAPPGLLDRARLLKDQSERGSHDLSDYYLDKIPPRDAAEYLGPVEIRKTEDGRGRGVFLTANARAGDLLFVNTAVVEFQEDEIDPDFVRMKEKLLRRVVERCKSSSRAAAQVSSMYAARSLEMEVPPMGIFAPNSSSCELGGGFNRGEELGGFDQGEDSAMPAWDEGYDFWGRNFFGLWPFHSFVNHSCCEANLSSRKIGNAFYAYAARDLESGSELLEAYWSAIALQPYRKRRSILPFPCHCARCEFERRLERENPELEFTENWEKSLAGLSRRERGWLRASHFHAYMRSLDREIPEEEFLESCREVSPGSFLALQAALHFMAPGRDNSRLEDFARATAIEACGRQKEEVIQAIVTKFRVYS